MSMMLLTVSFYQACPVASTESLFSLVNRRGYYSRDPFIGVGTKKSIQIKKTYLVIFAIIAALLTGLVRGSLG